MNPADVLIITASLSDALGCSVAKILAAAPNVSVRLEQLQNSANENSSPKTSSLGKTSIEQADIVLIVASRSYSFDSSSVVSNIKCIRSTMPVVIVNDVDTPEEIMEYFAIGASDYISAPLRAIDILPRIWRLIDFSRKNATLVRNIKRDIGLNQLVGKSPPFLAVIGKIPAIAQSDVSVQISGETGTGKEICARAIHYLGPRADKPFLPVNCGAIPTELVENELFGHVRGAFTGASVVHDGLISEANGGTLFLDEIDCLPLQAQVKILRLLQEREYRQLGSTKVRQADVRIIAATNIDLETAMRDGILSLSMFWMPAEASFISPPGPIRDMATLSPNFSTNLLADS